jgi:hypothetical protein
MEVVIQFIMLKFTYIGIHQSSVNKITGIFRLFRIGKCSTIAVNMV